MQIVTNWSKHILSEDLKSKFKRYCWPNKTWPTGCWLIALDLGTRLKTYDGYYLKTPPQKNTFVHSVLYIVLGN